MFETVVVPIDGSGLSHQALPAAAAIAAAGEAKVRLVAVAHNDGELAWMYQRAEEAAKLLPAEMTPVVDVFVDGDPVGVLLQIASDVSNVLCFGTHDRMSVAAELLGSVGSRVVERASHPFVIVGPNGSSGSLGTDVVVALDGVSDPELLLSTGSAWALRLGAALRIVTVYEPAPPDLRRPDHYTRSHGPPSDPDVYLDAMRHRVDDFGLARVDVAAIPDPVSVTAGLTQHLVEHPAFLLVAGGGRQRLLHASVVTDLLRGSPPPILVVQYHGSV